MKSKNVYRSLYESDSARREPENIVLLRRSAATRQIEHSAQGLMT